MGTDNATNDSPTWKTGADEAASQFDDWRTRWLLERLDYGLLVLDRFRRLVVANSHAKAALDESNLLGIRDGRVGPIDSRAGSDWIRAFERCLAGERASVVLTANGRRQRIAMEPFGPPLRTEGQCIAIFLERRVLCEDATLDDYANTHRLTQAERRVLRALVEGLDTKRIAERFGLSICTVRTHTKAILAKTGVPRVRDMLCEVGRMPPSIGLLPFAVAHSAFAAA